MAQEDEYTEELLLLTCSPHITGYNLEQLAGLLKMMVATIDGKICMLDSIRIDEAEHKLYGRGHEIRALGEYK
jgi:hypothetical protein